MMERKRLIIWSLAIGSLIIFSTALLCLKNSKKRARQARSKKLDSPQARTAMAGLLIESWKEDQRRSMPEDKQSCFDFIERFYLVEFKRIKECPCKSDSDCKFDVALNRCMSKDNKCTKFDEFNEKLKQACPESLIFAEATSSQGENCRCIKERCEKRYSGE